MKYGVYILLCMLWSIICMPYVFADNSRDLPGVDIISRAERGADESWKRENSGFYNRAGTNREEYQQRLAGEIADPTGKYAAKQERIRIDNLRTSFLLAGYPNDIFTEKTIRQEQGNSLLRNQQINTNKTKIVIHHTVTATDFSDTAAAMSGVREIYKYHAHQNGWGDIGYNFLIDEFGNIYEGRSGGKGAVGAHANRNNHSTIGIALMGNFEIEHPTPAMWRSLMQLILSITWEYDIDPFARQSYFTAIADDPYIIAHTHNSIVGHKDTKTTACPGEYVYERLPQLRAQVASYLEYFREQGGLRFDQLTWMKIDDPWYFSDDVGLVKIPFSHGGAVTCNVMDEQLTVRSCERKNDNELQVILEHGGYEASGWEQLLIKIGGHDYIVDVVLLWQDDLDVLLANKKNEWYTKYPESSPPAEKKMLFPTSVDQGGDLLDNDVSVLLYELTAEYDRREMSCDGGCDVMLDDETISNARIIHIIEDKEADALNIFIDQKKYTTTQATLSPAYQMIRIDNYGRNYGGYPMNLFVGELSFRKEEYKHLDLGRIQRYVVINTVPFDDYLQGMGEIVETQHIEKLKTMALLIKGYMLFYVQGKNPHRSLPDNRSYQAVDDPRIFQKYLGAGFAAYGKKRQQALAATQDILITYDDILPILPYYHCSAGFTKSARDHFGWTDTPWLVHVLDVARCEGDGFEGHGVGLSGDGAELLARKGVTYREIIKRYYPGVEVKDIR